jgi:serine/threonine protein kinase/tetratricopeptide (TPR) repeat protein
MSLSKKLVGHFSIAELIGKGGMGEVYLAEDTRLGRKVAIKFLAEKYSKSSGRLGRFVREAKAASALNHPNIITIYEIGEFEEMHFIATELIEGDTLHKRLKGKPLEIDFALDIAVQVASALEAAHKAGIVHRDIKPENVMIRPDGLVKILDFGIAKLTEKQDADPDGKTNFLVQTHPGMIMGTPQYMSPEQARGIAVDERTDIWSLGIVLFQMLTGFVPFQGDTMSDVIVAILERDVPPLEHFLKDFPADLEIIIRKSLRKKLVDRFKTIKEFGNDLKNLKRRIDFEVELEKSKVIDTADTIEMQSPAHFDSKSFSLSKAMNKDKLLLTEFTNLTGDPVFDVTLKTALAVSLEQSPFLDIFPDTEVRNTLRLMELSPDEPLTPQLGREICLRKGLKAYIAGTISSFGSIYVLTLEAINTETGESIARRLEQADSKEQVLKLLGNAATGLREKLGESLGSIEQFDAQFEYTTSSLDALKIYSLGVQQQRKGNWLQAISFYKQAITLDPDFSSAYVGASSSYSNTNQPKLAAEYAAKAFELKDNVSELEKLRISHFYYAYVTGELDQRIETLEVLRRIYPHVTTSLNNLADCYMQLGEFEKAISACRNSLKEKPHSAVSYDNLAMSLLHIGDFDEAKKTCELAIEDGLENIYFHNCLYQIAFVENDEAAMAKELGWMKGQPDEYMGLDLQAKTAAFRGQMKKSLEFSRRAVDHAKINKINGVAGTYLAERALRLAFCCNDKSDQFKSDVQKLTQEALKLERNPNTLPRVILAQIFVGLFEDSEVLIKELRSEYPKNTLVNHLWLPVINAARALKSDNAKLAIEKLQIVTKFEPAAEFYPKYIRGLAFLELGKRAEAEREFEKILSNRGESALSVLYPMAQLGLARAKKRVEDFEKFFELWNDADADLKILADSKNEFENLVA